jgi:hypothetical protein
MGQAKAQQWKEFRKKPVVIKALQFQPDVLPWPEGVENDAGSPTGFSIGGRADTLEQTSRSHEVTPGDWIIIGIAGERYACKDSIFVKTYDPVEQDNL